ncbi:BhlA/UviB family holin-like peptide [Symbiobacterium thermophilum]|nr:BhlA/UviB family holin-like peptide [Symbiobacterium thermophilum]
MEEGLMKLAIEQGLWAALFVGLLLWTLRQNNARETRYLEIIKTLGEEVRARLDRLESLASRGRRDE